MGSENPDDHQRVAAAEEQKKRKRAESNKKYYQKIKKVYPEELRLYVMNPSKTFYNIIKRSKRYILRN
ncbi:hypothetical protein OIU77_025111 [Salix suchowensis]|uniref:Uncharacterized protein n=1 Tax=Salix suchowensis TaxID=1278906 RepID=A0ABQ9BZF2_9ROSI|nr:hypothetical protein OIU77_025111 [Salix suchowensis]